MTLVEEQKGLWSRIRLLRWVAGGLLAVLAVLATVVSILAHRAEPFFRARIVEALETRFHARVELDRFHLSFGNSLRGEWGVWASGQGLRVWPLSGPGAPGDSASVPDQTGANPMIRLEEFRFHVPLHWKAERPLHISLVRMTGLQIHIPPRMHTAKPSPDGGVLQQSPKSEPAITGPSPSSTPEAGKAKSPSLFSSMVVERILCEKASLVMETSKPGKLPLSFAISRLVLTHVTAGGSMGFEADLTNPRPVGQIHSTGTFGPWRTQDPGESSIEGDYRFVHADLSGFKGIAGFLDSTGHYRGTLRDLVVDGETDTPDFRLSDIGRPMHLHTRFHARVDGTNGDTWLEPVDAVLGRSHFTAQGSIVRVRMQANGDGAGETGRSPLNRAPLQWGHEIALTVNVDRARIEDFLQLTTHAPTPLLTGPVTVKTSLRISPGAAKVHNRLRLDGSFLLSDVAFTSPKIQERISQLSLRGQGKPQELKTVGSGTIGSTMFGNFQMADGTLAFPGLTYKVPGATIQLTGSYGIERETLNFTGSAKMDATVSQMVGGWKGLLLRPADRFFEKGGAGTSVPIHIFGTRQTPDFGVDFGALKAQWTGHGKKQQ
jgi:hypothetical protein